MTPELAQGGAQRDFSGGSAIQVNMCHLGIVGSGIPHRSNFRTTRVAAATLGPALLPLVAELKDYCNLNALPCFPSCSVVILRLQGSEAMGLHAHLHDGVPMALIVWREYFWVEIGGFLTPSLRDKKRYTRYIVHKGCEVRVWACKATREVPVLFSP